MKLFLTGGFLGSGKTTAIKNACAQLLQNGVKAAVITNDQGTALVDTGFISGFNIPVQEVTNGCFCCKFNQLTQAITALCETQQPNVIFAESVGSCTDLVATVVKPLALAYPSAIIKLSVFADAALLYSFINNQSSFLNDQVRYIYKKQLAEADVLIINKIDLLQQDELKCVKQVIENDYTGKTVLYQSALDQQGIQQWLDILHNKNVVNTRISLEMDYDVYAAGEAMLAWHDETIEILTANKTAGKVALRLAKKIEAMLRKQQYLIGHLKFLLDTGDTNQKISFTAVAQHTADDTQLLPNNNVQLLINARVQADPLTVQQIIVRAAYEIASETEAQIVTQKQASFKPGYPKPTHRIA